MFSKTFAQARRQVANFEIFTNLSVQDSRFLLFSKTFSPGLRRDYVLNHPHVFGEPRDESRMKRLQKKFHLSRNKKRRFLIKQLFERFRLEMRRAPREKKPRRCFDLPSPGLAISPIQNTDYRGRQKKTQHLPNFVLKK